MQKIKIETLLLFLFCVCILTLAFTAGVFMGRVEHERIWNPYEQTSQIVIPHAKIEQDGNATQNYVLVFSAVWCGPCQNYKPTLERLKSEGYLVYFIDVDKAPESKSLMNVSNIPATFIMSNGQIVKRFDGQQSYEMLIKVAQKPKSNTPSPTPLDYKLY